MIDNKNNEEYIELLNKIRKELPNLVLPSMGMIDDIEQININAKDYIINNGIEEA